ncbi:hypothetical protein MH117_09530 [Paenibacillus sp. ACRRX]|uniref:hypothetical protein n=1 Tax=unclassified Paenibacillus TaxID=185978 RepID=UPI001EF48093|nr:MULTISPECIES: hypothetical protein [unclassified Paenibacillus]MCG7407665.1 hypothetical protein [Paenibacillus sp. ACRRX]MDK8180900.1 hypothetical protein [Paenibacillus sp. UMB4589-SE434]
MLGAQLFVWLLGVFGIVAVLCWLLSRLLVHDSTNQDERYIWLRKIDDGSGKEH